MMLQPKNTTSELLEAINFPKKGEVLQGVKVLSSKAAYENDILNYEIILPKGTKSKAVPKILRQFFSTQVISTAGNLVVKHHDYTVSPSNGNVCVKGSMHIASVVRMNPSMQEFDEEYSSMEMTNPETYFKKYEYRGFNSPQFRAKLFSMVSYMGENYGYCDDKCIYHRRASLVMPKIKITKAVPSAKMMYHTHPKKDEPSLSSADDYLIYMDLSHEPRSIRHFCTVMEDRMDHFEIKPKKGSKQNFLKLDEDKIIEEIDAKISDLEKKWDAKMPKDGASKEDNLRYCENITRDLVNWMNTKYGKYFSFKYKCHYRVKKNPPEPTADDLHLKDEFLQKAVSDTRTRTYSWPEFDTGKMPHENYAYWHQAYYTQHVKDSFMTLGVTPKGADRRRYDQYMNKLFEGTTFTNFDALNMLNLAYDIAAQDAKIRDGNGFKSRMVDLCQYMEISEEACETLVLLEEVIHGQDVFSEQAQILAGDYYALVLLSYYSISAVHTIERVKKGEIDPDMAKFEVYSKLKQEISDALSSFLTSHESLFEKGFIDSYLNPPRMTLKRTDYLTKFPVEALELYDLVAEALEPFSKTRYDPKRPFYTDKSKFNLWVQTKGGRVGMMISQYTGSVEVTATTENPMEDAMEAVDKVGQALYRAGLPVNPEEFGLMLSEGAMNPQRAQVIILSGPSGSGKSTTIRNLLKALPNARTAPTVTTRQKRRSDKPGERVFVSKGEFLHMVSQGDLVAVQLQRGGDYYAKRLSDFEKEGYVVIEVSLNGLNQMKKIFPGAYTVYLEPVDDPEMIRKRLLRRGDMSAKDAKGRAAIIPQHIAASKKMDFDLRIPMKQGEFDVAAKKIIETIPKQNPSKLDDYANIGVTEEDVLPKSIIWDYTKRGTGLDMSDEYEIVNIPVEELDKAFQKSPMHVPTNSDGKVEGIAAAARYETPLPILQGGFVGEAFEFTDGRHRFAYTRDYTDDKTVPIAMYKTEAATTKLRFKDKIKERFARRATKRTIDKAFKEGRKTGKSYDTRMPSRLLETITYGTETTTHSDTDKASGKSANAIFQGEEYQAKFSDASIERQSILSRLLRRKPIRVPLSLGTSFSPKSIERVARMHTLNLAKHIQPGPETIDLDVPYQVFAATRTVLWRASVTRVPTRDYRGEEIGLIERDAEQVREAMYLLAHQMATDHEFAHQADFVMAPGGGFASGATQDISEKREDTFKRQAETVSQAIEGEMIYTAVIPIESSVKERLIKPDQAPYEGATTVSGNILVVALSRAYYTMAGEVDYKGLKFGVPKLADDYYPVDVSYVVIQTGDFADMRKKEAEIRAQLKTGEQYTDSDRFQGRIATLVNPPKDNFDWFEEWAKLINMKNKEIVAFMKSDWFKVSGLTPGEAKEAGIRSGQNSLRAIMRMRKKLGLTGPKDYIPNGPRIIESYYEKALKNWTKSDWEWCKHQVRFNKRAGAFPYNPNAEERKGPLVKEMKTYARPSRKLLSLWVWGHDPWRWARKNGYDRMSPCPQVPWIGMTEKKKWGTIEVEMSPRKKNPSKTPEGRKIPERYLKGLNKEEMIIAAKEIDKGYKYDINDPKAYEFWKSDIKATARGYETVPSKYKKKFIEMYGPLPEEGEFLDKMSKATGIKKSILQKVYDKGLAAWRGEHRPGVQQHQWAAGRVYSFVTLGNTVKKGNKKMPDYKLAIEAGLVKDNPPKISHYPDPDPESPKDMQRIDAHIGDENVGFLTWYQADEERVIIHYLNVKKNFRKQGIGKQLLNELQRLPQVEGKRIHLYAPIAGGPRDWVSKWYERLGFVVVDKKSNEMILQNPNIKDSEIHGQGLFADENINKGETVVTEPVEVKYINHSDSPNLTARYLPDETLEYVAKVDINQGSELTLDYRQLAILTGHPEAKSEASPETLYNPNEWRHGEFAEEDPFEEYF